MLSLDQIRMIRKNEKRLTLSCVSLIYVIVCVRVTQKIFSFYALGNLALQCGSHFQGASETPEELVKHADSRGTPSKMPDQYDDAHSNCFLGAIKVKGTQVSIYG